MSKTKIIDIVRKFCVAQGQGVGFQKYIKAANQNIRPTQFQPKNFDVWYTGPGEYLLQTYATRGREDAPVFDYIITLP